MLIITTTMRKIRKVSRLKILAWYELVVSILVIVSTYRFYTNPSFYFSQGYLLVIQQKQNSKSASSQQMNSQRLLTQHFSAKEQARF